MSVPASFFEEDSFVVDWGVTSDEIGLTKWVALVDIAQKETDWLDIVQDVQFDIVEEEEKIDSIDIVVEYGAN